MRTLDVGCVGDPTRESADPCPQTSLAEGGLARRFRDALATSQGPTLPTERVEAGAEAHPRLVANPIVAPVEPVEDAARTMSLHRDGRVPSGSDSA